MLPSVSLLKGIVPAETAQRPQKPELEWKAQLCSCCSSVRHITPLVGLESNVMTQSQQPCTQTLGLEPTCQPCPHICPRTCLGLFELIKLQCLENSRPILGPVYNL